MLQTEPNFTFRNSTLRQTLRVTTGGNRLRLRISNAFGSTLLPITAVTVALPSAEPGQKLCGSKSVQGDSIRHLAFGGQGSVEIPNGALAVSDDIDLPVLTRQILTVTMYFRNGHAGGHVTGHPGSRTWSWLCHGDHTASEDLDGSDLQSVAHWYYISGVEFWQGQQNCSMVLLGDSLTDGRCSTDNGNDRWPDLLFDRMVKHDLTRHVALINQAAGGSRMLKDERGPNLMSRLDRDVFAQPGVRYVFVFYGVNDIGTTETDVESQTFLERQMILAYKQIISRVHAFGFLVFASTIGPFTAPQTTSQGYSHPSRERTRQAVNEWIRNSSSFDAVVDFDKVLRDPQSPSTLNPEFDSGDHLHPTVAAFKAMADTFPLDLFQRFSNGP